MDYFNVILTTFLSLEHVCCIAVYAGSEIVDLIKNIFVYLCSEDKWVLRVCNDMMMSN